MVGVPFFSSKCLSGPSRRIGCPCVCMDLSHRITDGPSRKLTTNAVRQAAPDLNVM